MTYRRSRVFTYAAVALALAGMAGIAALLVLVNKLDQQYGSIQRDLDHFTARVEEEKKSAEELNGERRELESTGDKLRKSIGELNDKKARLEMDIVSLSKKTADLEQRSKDAGLIIETSQKAQAKIGTLNEQIDSLRKETTDLEKSRSELDDLKGQIGRLNSERDSLTNVLGSVPN